MEPVALFVRDFRLGTGLSNHLVSMECGLVFHERAKEMSPGAGLAVVDLDEEDFGTVRFINEIKAVNREIRIVGYMKQMQKERHDKLKAAGCRVILTRSSIVRNIQSLIKGLEGEGN